MIVHSINFNYLKLKKNSLSNYNGVDRNHQESV